MRRMRKPNRPKDPVDFARSQPASRTDAAVQPAGKGAGLRVIVEASRSSRPHRQTVELVSGEEASLAGLAKLLVHHLEPDLKDILK
jgi:hypothetical protein